MLKIFAKYGTDEKIAVFCHKGQIAQLRERFENEYGGIWMLVDECMTGGEILKFNDSQIYKGFEADDNKRYSSAIKRFSLNSR